VWPHSLWPTDAINEARCPDTGTAPIAGFQFQKKPECAPTATVYSEVLKGAGQSGQGYEEQSKVYYFYFSKCGTNDVSENLQKMARRITSGHLEVCAPDFLQKHPFQEEYRHT
jgi:hypothetical protein